MEATQHLAPVADQSPTLAELAKALAKAQGAMRAAVKDETNPDFNSKYATLASVLEACRDPLASNGLSYLQPVSTADGEVIVTTILLHSSGEFIRSRAAFPVAKKNPQAYGSALTYLRRYALASLVGIAAEEDDDGAAASQTAGAGSTQERPARRAEDTKGDPKLARVAKLWKAAQNKGMDEARFKTWLAEVLGGEKTSDELTPKELFHLERALKDFSAGKEGASDAASH